ncbi:MAG: sensor histidine kinase [Flavobacteriaceae bacterium]|nr:MAG: sensor histidine kinase [Flavobacteriaceae bacterium]
MHRVTYIFVLFLVTFSTVLSQEFQNKITFEIKGSVKGKENFTPISGVEVSSSSGGYTTTDGLGEFKIKVSLGDELVLRSPELETVYYIIKSDEDVDVLVKGYKSKGEEFNLKTVRKKAVTHQSNLDSANFYKKNDIGKSIDFITQSIASLGKRANKKQLAESLTALGEVYQYHNQYDLAIQNYEDALAAQKTIGTTLLLGNVYILNGAYEKAETILLPLIDVKVAVPFQRVKLYEELGDTYKNLHQVNKAVAYYKEGLTIAKKNQIVPKVTDLNSKIADAYAEDNRSVEAEGFYNQSLNLAKKEAPQRSVREKNKVADFFNTRNQYDDEIELRKESLEELKQLSEPVVEFGTGILSLDSITPQRINYKIANAYISQNQYDAAIPFLKQSIEEADRDDDLIVQKDATRKLSEVYRETGDFTKALEAYQKYGTLVDTLYVRKEQEISRAVRFNREIASRQNRIAGLEQERELSKSKYDLALTSQELTRESNKRQEWIIYSLLLGLLLLGTTTFFFYRINKQQKLANNLLALKSLRSQMNPHFIFNALNSVNNYIAKSDERSANRYLSDFSTLMRSVLENSEEDFIPLYKELELLELYVKLEHSRFPDKFDYKINLDKNIDVNAFQIPPMLLQPYIENAIWHGLRYKDEKGFLNIDLVQKDNEIIEITIKDNGIGRKKSAQLKTANQKRQKSKGMGNIKKRIDILNEMYKNKVAVSISNLNDKEGTKVILTLKKD